MRSPPESVSRRALLRRSLAGAAATAAPLLGCALRSKGQDTNTLVVVSVDDVLPGQALRTTYAGQPVILFNQGGAIRVFSGLCTHEACELGWNERQQLIRCPCHGSAFDTEGRVRKGPATEDLAEFAATVREGRVFLPATPIEAVPKRESRTTKRP